MGFRRQVSFIEGFRSIGVHLISALGLSNEPGPPQIELKKTTLLVWSKSIPDQNRAFRFRPFESFFESGAKTNRPLQPVKDALFLSGRTFLKLGVGTTYPRERMLVWIAYLEWAVGMFMLIHLLVALKNTLPIALLFFGT